MAKLFKASKRGGHLPRIVAGRVETGIRPDYASEGSPPVIVHTLTISGRGGEATVGSDVEYEVRLTDLEMLSVTAKWMAEYSRRQSALDFDRRRAEAKAKGEHDTRDSPLRSRA